MSTCKWPKIAKQDFPNLVRRESSSIHLAIICSNCWGSVLVMASLALCLLMIPFVRGESLNMFPLLMPHVHPERDETYFCTSVKVDPSVSYYITAFEPNASMATAHHMIISGCQTPGSDEEFWNCGGMEVAQSGRHPADACGTGRRQIIYAWARDAPKLVLPEGVGFKVGGDTDLQYLVLQVHYASVEKFKDGSTDDSGAFLHFTETPQRNTAGVLLLITSGQISPHSVEYMETACTINEDKVIHPFAYRTHTHSLGRVVSGYKVSRNEGVDEWTLIGKKDPQLPQMFYPVDNEMTIAKGDTVAARCTMESKRDRTTYIGPTNEHEMCNFYIMYWTDGPILDQRDCFSFGPPYYRWGDYPGPSLNNVPDADASSLPVGTSADELGIHAHQT